MRLRTILAIAKKDVVDAFRNARLLLIVLMPIGFSLLYGYMFRDTPNSIEIVLYSPDATDVATQLAEFNNVSLFVVQSASSVETKLEEEKAAIGVVLPEGFDDALQAGETPVVELIHRERLDEASSAQRLVLHVIEAISGRAPMVEVHARSLIQPSAEEMGAESEEPMGFLAGLSLQSFFIVLWVMMGITMNGSFLVPTILVEEKDKKTLDSVLVAPASYYDVVVAKLLVGVLYSLLTALVVMGLNRGFVGDIGFSMAVVLLSSITLSLIGLLIGGLVDNMSTLNTWGGFIMVPLILPGILAGGAVGNLSQGLTIALQVVPTYHLARGLALSLSGKGAQAWLNIGILVVESLLLFGAVVWSLRRRER